MTRDTFQALLPWIVVASGALVTLLVTSAARLHGATVPIGRSLFVQRRGDAMVYTHGTWIVKPGRDDDFVHHAAESFDGGTH